MRELRSLGSVRGALSNGRPYRDKENDPSELRCQAPDIELDPVVHRHRHDVFQLIQPAIELMRAERAERRQQPQASASSVTQSARPNFAILYALESTTHRVWTQLPFLADERFRLDPGLDPVKIGRVGQNPPEFVVAGR